MYIPWHSAIEFHGIQYEDISYILKYVLSNQPPFQIPVLNVVGAYSPFVEETVQLNGKLNPANVNWLKIQDSAMVIEEQPGKIAEAFRLFMQGQGYCLKLRKMSVQGLLS